MRIERNAILLLWLSQLRKVVNLNLPTPSPSLPAGRGGPLVKQIPVYHVIMDERTSPLP